MEVVRKVAYQMRNNGEIVVKQKGEVIEGIGKGGYSPRDERVSLSPFNRPTAPLG